MKKTALNLQLVWAAFSILWNIIGSILLSQGKQALGPTASWTAALILLIFGILLWFAFQKNQKLYAFLSVLVILLVTKPLFNAFTGDASLWPSVFWRILGAVINFMGLIGSFLGIKQSLKL